MGLTAALLPFHLLSAVDSLGISDELKEKLEDVLIPEQQFTLGRMLGKGVGVLGDQHEFALSEWVVPFASRA